MVENRKAFTMIEIIFVIGIIVILASVAISKFIEINEPNIKEARKTVVLLKNTLKDEREKRILKGDFSPIYRLTDSNLLGHKIFNAFNGDTKVKVLENPPYSCAHITDIGCWRETQTGAADGTIISQYTYNLPNGDSVVFILDNNQFKCLDKNSSNCKLLTFYTKDI